MKGQIVLGRRAFLREGSLLLSAGLLAGARALEALAEERKEPVLQVGLVTDVHHADKDSRINRAYRESVAKLKEGVDHFRDAKADFVVELGDLIDGGTSFRTEVDNLRRITAELARFPGDRFHVLGNHCLASVSKQEFLQHSEAKHKESFYSFDRGAFHFVVLDACFRADGQPYERGNYQWQDSEIPPAERDWLLQDLSETTRPTFVFVHQRLDTEGVHAVKSAAAVRQILQKTGRVRAVFQGHSHKNEYREVEGIHYCTLRAMVEGSGEANNGYSLLKIFGDGSAHLVGFRQQRSYQLSRSLRIAMPPSQRDPTVAPVRVMPANEGDAR